MSDEKPLVSVVTPAYNAGSFIGETIASVLAQTYENFEMLVVDDGSTDNTADVIKSFAERDSRIKYIYQKNAGQSSARNAAIAVARGKYIALLDHDDIYYPKKLAEQIAFMEANPDCGFSYCKIYHFYSDHPEAPYYFPLEHPSGYLFDKLLVSNFINPLSVVIRKDVLEKFGSFEPKFPWADEQFLWLKLSYNKVKFCYLDIPLGQCRLHPTSFTNRRNYYLKSREQCLEILDIFKKKMTKEEVVKYRVEELEKNMRKNMIVGKLMAGDNLLASSVHALYLWNRRRRLKKVTS
jgi:glycosyltransferase involved in cell wall biosynthesis